MGAMTTDNDPLRQPFRDLLASLLVARWEVVYASLDQRWVATIQGFKWPLLFASSICDARENWPKQLRAGGYLWNPDQKERDQGIIERHINKSRPLVDWGNVSLRSGSGFMVSPKMPYPETLTSNSLQHAMIAWPVEHDMNARLHSWTGRNWRTRWSAFAGKLSAWLLEDCDGEPKLTATSPEEACEQWPHVLQLWKWLRTPV